MAAIGSWVQSREFLVLVGFHLFIALMLALDLGVFRRKAHTVSMKEAGVWSAVWVALAGAFAVLIWQLWHRWEPGQAGQGPVKAVEFVTGYLVELSLSVDNLFVFLVIFRYFAVPEHLRHRVLLWGILGAVVMRASFILIGAALLHVFHPIIYVFGAFLIYTGYKLFRAADEELDPGKNPLLRLARRFLRVTHAYESNRFWVRRDRLWYATPLPLVLLVVESTDVVFAVDSIPAIFAITKDPFIVYTSNIFAILGLRSFYFLLAGFLGMFRYLNVGLACVLIFVGVKMIGQEWIGEERLNAYGLDNGDLSLISLGVITAILAVAVVASVLAGPKEPQELPEGVAVGPAPAGGEAPAAGEDPGPPAGHP